MLVTKYWGLEKRAEAESESLLRDSWNRLSADYQKEHAIGTEVAHWGVLAPNEDQLRLLGDVRGRLLLEIGCGGGQNAIAFARRGATCLGIDLSDAQIAHAVALAEQEEVAARAQFRQGEMIAALRALAAAGETFDVVFSAYALQYVEDLPGCFAAVYSVLRPGGVFAFSLDHPLSDIAGYDTDVQQVTLYRGYFDRTRYQWDWNGLPMTSFHRTVGDIVAAVVGSGLILERLLEPEPVAEMTSFVSDDQHEIYARIPATIIVRASRP